MNTDILYAFAAGMLILAITPGPGVIGAVSKAVSEGFRASLIFIGGLVLGDTIFFLLALGGMSVISEWMGNMFLIVKVAGGIYLFYLGVRMFRSSTLKTSGQKVQYKGKIKTFTGGLVLTLGNPKPILFYASVLPAIINLKSVTVIDAAALIAVIITISFLVLGFYSFFASLSGKYLTKKSNQVKANKSAGILMCATGTYIALK